jgi:hypothetical protein
LAPEWVVVVVVLLCEPLEDEPFPPQPAISTAAADATTRPRAESVNVRLIGRSPIIARRPGG